jgi:serine/threonine-protein kinase HipA
MLAATDGHAKNFSIRLLRGGRYHLTAFYDVLSAWPIIGKTASKIPRQKVKLAMSVKGKHRYYNLDTIRRHHFEQMAQHFGIGAKGATLIDQLIKQTPSVIETVHQDLPQDYPHKLLDAVCENLLDASTRLSEKHFT